MTHYLRYLSFMLGLCTTVITANSQRAVPASYESGAPVNYIRVWDAVKPVTDATSLVLTTDINTARITTQYMDGAGRLMQTVVKKGSMITGQPATDLIDMVEYDGYGRESYKYLPTPARTTGMTSILNDGGFKRDAFAQQADFYGNGSTAINPLAGQGETHFYSHTGFEASPLGRIEELFAPGNSWAGTESATNAADRKSVKIKRYNNTATDAVRIWEVTDVAGNWGTYNSPGSYEINGLFKTITEDEHGKQVIEFKDKRDLVILKKVQLTATADDGSGSGYSGWLSTYYIYDPLSRLRCVVQPEGVQWLAANSWNLGNATVLAEQSFRYEYDGRSRMIRKKVPGAGDTYMVYDQRDRPVMIQDAVMRAESAGKWLVTLYDVLNRPVETGIYSGSASTSFATHLSNAATGSNYYYPFNTAPGSGWESLTKTYYDAYGTLPAGLDATYLNSWNSLLMAQDLTTTYPYPVTPVKSNFTKGLVTWTQTKILGTANWITTVLIYDDKSRVIQQKIKNETGGIDVTTTQYGWQGAVARIVEKKAGANSVQQVLTTYLHYDALGRLLKTDKQLNSSQGGLAANNELKTISELSYDALGRVKRKDLGKGTGSTVLETQSFDYNIRGWLLGINRSELSGNNNSTGAWFAFDLGYDKLNNNIGAKAYAARQLNGNITGMVWESKGDGIRRKYDYSYDAANRLLKGDFEQSESSSWSNATVNYNIKMGDGISPVSAYDGNGNIKQMQQWGLKGTASTQIDNLSYAYTGTLSNRLGKVTDGISGTDNGRLGDFKDGANGSTDDYSYDSNGNLTKDENKNIATISYNHLNLPKLITMKSGKGTITYGYDAAGIKLRKTTVENNATVSHNGTNYTGVTITGTTVYQAGMVYESKQYSNATLNTALGYSNELQYIGMEEGRIRYVKAEPLLSKPSAMVYDYMLKDHLGNVRAVLTDEVRQDAYPAASMETANAAVENSYYDRITDTRFAKPSGYPSASTSGTQVSRVGGSSSSVYSGPGKLLKVMAGDKINLSVYSWWQSSFLSINSASPAEGLLSLLLAGIPGTSGGKIAGSDISETILNPGLLSFIAEKNANTGTRPKAYVNWLLLDEQFNYVESGSGAETVGSSGVLTHHVKSNLQMPKNGYLYVYVSNSSVSTPVYFDDLVVTHTRGPLLEETHYYPFGLSMAGISSKALNGISDNRWKFNEGSELENKEFSDGSGLDWYDTDFRKYDAQIGRFVQIDDLAELFPNYTPYNYTENNPILYNDPTGLSKQGYGFEEDDFADETLDNVEVTPTSNARNNASSHVNWLGWPSYGDKTGKQLQKETAAQLSRKDQGLPYLPYGDTTYYNRSWQADQEWRKANYAVLEIMSMAVPVPKVSLLQYLKYGGNSFKTAKALIWAKNVKPVFAPIINPVTGKQFRVYAEIHHRFIPQRWRLPNWITNSRINLQITNSIEHAVKDQYRYQFLPKWVKEAVDAGVFKGIYY